MNSDPLRHGERALPAFPAYPVRLTLAAVLSLAWLVARAVGCSSPGGSGTDGGAFAGSNGSGGSSGTGSDVSGSGSGSPNSDDGGSSGKGQGDGSTSTADGVSSGSGGDGAITVLSSVRVYQTSRAAGPGGTADHMTDIGILPFATAPSSGRTTISVDLGQPKQEILGFGAALTEASASVVNALPMAKQQEILNAYFGPNGSGYTLARTHIGSCDFALSAYSYDDSATPDPTLAKFSIAHDQTLLLPFLKSAVAASGGALRILASPWSAPAWMKDNNLLQGHGSDGSLLAQYYTTYAQYLSKYLQAYNAAGVSIWGITTQNEPLGVNGSREGMSWSTASMNQFIRDDLGPQLKMDNLASTKIFFFDHNKGPAGSDVVTWGNAILKDPKTNPFVAGTAVHWYGSTFRTYEDGLDALHAIDPSKFILFDEGTDDGLADIAFGNASAAYKYSWLKDDWYWKKDGYDWGYWYASRTDHPAYEPVYRYVRDIIVGLNHWYGGFIDWNAVLNKDGGPGHVTNACADAIMVDTAAGTIYYSPIFYAMQHFSKFIRPQARVVASTVKLATGVVATDYDGTPTQDGNALLAAAAQNVDGSVALVLFNETGAPIDYSVVVGVQSVASTIPAQSLQTLVWQ